MASHFCLCFRPKVVLQLCNIAAPPRETGRNTLYPLWSIQLYSHSFRFLLRDEFRLIHSSTDSFIYFLLASNAAPQLLRPWNNHPVFWGPSPLKHTFFSPEALLSKKHPHNLHLIVWLVDCVIQISRMVKTSSGADRQLRSVVSSVTVEVQWWQVITWII